MRTIRCRDMRVGGLYRWATGDPDEFFLVLGLPGEWDPVRVNRVQVLSNKTSKRDIIVYLSDKYVEVA